ncbi:MAG: NAD(P)/FAD-dependent oxidoreductase [Geodermatophilales bacterium]|nr:NAD(P)/FAD-dependent oxidoreductase [Geodermatophilales bacterium]
MDRSDAAPDAVVIGAGHNGLVAANILADAGWDVVVCEATAEPGGAVRSARVTAPGFISDLFSAFYPLGAASPVLQALELDRHGLTWSHAPAVLSHVLPDGRSATMYRDVALTAESVSSFAAEDGIAWRELVAQWRQVEQPLLDALFRPFPPVVPAARLARRVGLAGLARLARAAMLPARRFGDEWFEGEGAALLVAGCAMHADIPVDGAGSGAFGWLLAMVGQQYGFPVPRGGAGKLTEALTARLSSRGGTVRVHAPVHRVLIEHGRAAGVLLRSGETLRARRAVLADVNAPALYGELVGFDRLPRRLVEDLRNFQWDAPTLKVNWALSGPVPWQVAGARDAGTVHLGVDMDGLTSFSAALARREVPREPFVLFGQLTTADPTRSPAGTESAWGYTHLPLHGHLTEDDVARQVDLVEAAVERHAPGFTASILGRFVQSPVELTEENPNLEHGSINGGTAQLHQQLVFRPTVGLGGAATPVDGLFLAGSSGHPGGGVHGGPGANAARAALGREGWTGWLRRQATRTLMSRLYRDLDGGDEPVAPLEPAR